MLLVFLSCCFYLQAISPKECRFIAVQSLYLATVENVIQRLSILPAAILFVILVSAGGDEIFDMVRPHI
jgi:hypothetical protein